MDKQEVPTAENGVIHEFVKTLMAKLASLDETFMQFLQLPHLKMNDELNMFTGTSVLVKLITDLKTTGYQTSKQYAGLLSLRTENLSEAISKGKPRMKLEQPDADIPHLPDVQQFLRSNQQTYTRKVFGSIHDARSWASKHFPSGWSRSTEQEKKGYRCNAFTRGSGKNAYVEITKEPREFEKEQLKRFEQFGPERRQHKVVLKAILGDNTTGVPGKKPLRENNVIDLSGAGSTTDVNWKNKSSKIVLDDDDSDEDYNAGKKITPNSMPYHKRYVPVKDQKRAAGRTPRTAATKKKKYTHNSSEEEDPDHVA